MIRKALIEAFLQSSGTKELSNNSAIDTKPCLNISEAICQQGMSTALMHK